jgi:hypothetical protein
MARGSLGVALLAEIASGAGLVLPTLYRDNPLVSAGWMGNDLVTLFAAAPALGLVSAGRAPRSPARELIRLGLLDYMLYNYAFYLFGAAFNALFLLYVVIVTLAAAELIRGLLGLEPTAVARAFPASVAWRAVGAYLVLVASGLGAVYAVQSLDYVATGRLPAIVSATGHPTSVVFALDLTLVVPPSLLAGIWIWQDKPWGHALAVILTVKGAVYMTALSAATASAWQSGALASASQLFFWGALGVSSALACAALLGANRPRLSP